MFQCLLRCEQQCQIRMALSCSVARMDRQREILARSNGCWVVQRDILGMANHEKCSLSSDLGGNFAKCTHSAAFWGGAERNCKKHMALKRF